MPASRPARRCIVSRPASSGEYVDRRAGSVTIPGWTSVAIELARSAVDDSFASGEMIWRWLAVTAMVESLLARGTGADLKEAQSAIDRLAAVPTDPGFVLHELPLLRLRGLVAPAHGDAPGHDEFMARLRARAEALGFEPLVAATTSVHS
ncbi:hypothetical protein C3477_05910 [Mycobacterium kansasii]|nr:hypothetical protein C3B43_02680 [Mycobacterium kansasii]POX91588.1 hypothetical protein C3B43_03100 [Mycobacterium kansasii]POY07880.1 hypothetical protein C3477_05910 [Mycobacterium kansasii]POY23075.1 hypothetical protein C3476_08850 [Mycobacterium kansasii]